MCFCVFTRTSLFVLGLVMLCFVYFLFCYCLVASTSAVDCLERLVSKMTYYVSSGMSNHTRSLTHINVVSRTDKLRILSVKLLTLDITGVKKESVLLVKAV